MTAHEIALLPYPASAASEAVKLSAEATLAQVLRALTEQGGTPVEVASSASVSAAQTLSALSTLIPDLPDTSEISVSCLPGQYSASALARAVEDADANLITLLSHPTPDDRVNITLRIDHADPSAAVHSLERYGFNVTGAAGADYTEAALTRERISALERYMNI